MTTTITILSLFPNISAPTVASPADTVLSEFTYVDTHETILIYTTHCASDDNVFQQRKCKIWCLNGTLTVYILYNLHKYKPHLCMQSVSSTVMLKLKKPHVTGKHLCTYNEHNQHRTSTDNTERRRNDETSNQLVYKARDVHCKRTASHHHEVNDTDFINFY